MDATVGADTREELSRDPYPVYRRLPDEGACGWLDAANRYVVPRWEDVVGLDEVPGITAREEPSLMTRAIGRTMLRTDGEEHARLRAPAHAPLRFRGFAERWGDMLCREAHDLLAPVHDRGHMDVLREPARSPLERSSCCSAFTPRATRTSRPRRRRLLTASARPATRPSRRASAKPLTRWSPSPAPRSTGSRQASRPRSGTLSLRYKRAVDVLAQQGSLTAEQAATLHALADQLATTGAASVASTDRVGAKA
jgi:hypothetical protein